MKKKKKPRTEIAAPKKRKVIRLKSKKPSTNANPYVDGNKRMATPPIARENSTMKELLTKGIRLNKYVSNAGIASRRKADELIKKGLVAVNDKVIVEMGYKVKKGDKVTFEGKLIRPENKVYVLLNKPKNCITTLKDERGRKTVMDIVQNASTERLYPVGRLDRHTTGLLFLTNDGELAQKLGHPSGEVRKLYHVFLDKPVHKNHLRAIVEGVTLDDGIVPIDSIDYVAGSGKKEIGIQIHIGRNRIIRRLFEHLGYKVIKLDRVIYGGLTKKDLPRGKWRYLHPREIIMLKHFKG